jgi:hypothetical protein
MTVIHEYAEARGSGIPASEVNGGLYTGAPFARGAGWANVPIAPDSTAFVQRGLQMGNAPPPGATVQLVQSPRPGSTLIAPDGLTKDDRLNMLFAVDGK